jgi:signal transduction histidine kinase
VEAVLAAQADQLRADGVVCSISAEGNPIVLANPTHIRQVLENLLRNAWQAMAKSETKQLRISWEKQTDPPTIRVAIEDTGAGIPPDLRDKVFLPFFTTNPSKQGAGLGLPISRRIARLYGGDLTFASKPGQTVFTLTLPTQRDG